jgi:hypothetical protein
MFWLSHLERRTQPLAPHRLFLKRVWRNFLASVGIVTFSLALGTTGYHYIGGLSWLDGLLNSSMILTGMGPVDRMETVEGKLFATFYALYSGLAFLTMMAVVIAPIYHRFLHRFHLSTEDDEHRIHRRGL